MTREPIDRTFHAEVPGILDRIYRDETDDTMLDRYADFVRLYAWLVNPSDAWAIEVLAKTAVARVLHSWRAQGEDPARISAIFDHHFPPSFVEQLLLDGVPFIEMTEHEQAHTNSQVAVSMAKFMLQLAASSHSKKHAPSINRALHFVGQGGHPDLNYPLSHQTARDLWKEFASTAPFHLAENLLSPPIPDGLEESEPSDRDISRFAPYGEEFYQVYLKAIGSGDLKLILETAHYLQSLLDQTLQRESLERLSLVPFPQIIPKTPIALPALDDRQIHILRSYRA